MELLALHREVVSAGRRGQRRFAAEVGIGSIGVLLVAAAILKAASPGEAAELEVGLNWPRWLVIAAIAAELAAGTALVFRIRSKLTWMATMSLFGAFAAYSLLRALAAYESCGCFGAIHVHPVWTFCLDVAVLCVLIGLRGEFVVPQRQQIIPSRAWCMTWLVLTAISILLLYRLGPSQLRDSVPDDAGELVILQPEDWLDEEFPLQDLLTPSIDVSQGQWIILMYHHDCPKCQEALPHYQGLVEQTPPDGQPAQVLVIEVPPYGPAPQAGAAHHARLHDRSEWFVQAPVEIVLINGKVTSASLDLPSIAHQQ